MEIVRARAILSSRKKHEENWRKKRRRKNGEKGMKGDKIVNIRNKEENKEEER